jgi:methionyl-tRNA formyltransferase
MDLIFLGTPTFAVPTLKMVLEAGHKVLTVVTQPDRPKGRGQVLSPSPVKEAALAHGLPVFQPERIRQPEVVERLGAMKAEAMVVVGYGQIIPQSIISLPRHGILNVHASLLPKYRGAAPVQWAIVNGETITGVTTMRIDAGLDTGDMLLKAETAIGPEETAIDLGNRLASMGADLLVETLARIETLVPEKQNAAQATYAPILKKEDGRIDWKLPAAAIHNRVRGLVPWPGAFTKFRGHPLHIWKTWGRSMTCPGPPGRLIRAGKSLQVICGDGSALELLELQLEGKKRISGEAFANGQRLQENESFGDLS